MPKTDLRSFLKVRTFHRHKRIDARFSRFDLASLDGYARFLLAHSIAVRSALPVAAEFVRSELHHDMPDYHAMIGEDLASLPLKTRPLADAGWHSDNEHPSATAGLTYVLLGSRLGLAALFEQYRRSVAWDHPIHTSAFIRDRVGISLWRAFLDWSAALPCEDVDPVIALRGAQACFDLYTEAGRIAEAAELAQIKGVHIRA